MAQNDPPDLMRTTMLMAKLELEAATRLGVELRRVRTRYGHNDHEAEHSVARDEVLRFLREIGCGYLALQLEDVL